MIEVRYRSSCWYCQGHGEEEECGERENGGEEGSKQGDVSPWRVNDEPKSTLVWSGAVVGPSFISGRRRREKRFSCFLVLVLCEPFIKTM